MVAISRDGTHSAVLFPVRHGLSESRGRYYIAFLNSACQQVGPTLDIGPYGGDPYHDMAIDDSGRVAVVKQTYAGGWRRQLDLFSPEGAWTASLDTTNCQAGLYGGHVALHKTSGEGVMTCQGGANDPLKFRRFNTAGQWLDADFQSVATSAGGHGSWYDSHAVGMFNDGRFAIIWLEYNPAVVPRTSDHHLSIYSTAGVVQSSVIVSTSTDYGFDGYRGYHPAVLQPIGDDFLLPVATYSTFSLLRMNTGAQVIADGRDSEINPVVLQNTGARFLLQTLRSNAAGDYYYLEQHRWHIRKNIALGTFFVPVLGR